MNSSNEETIDHGEVTPGRSKECVINGDISVGIRRRIIRPRLDSIETTTVSQGGQCPGKNDGVSTVAPATHKC